MSRVLAQWESEYSGHEVWHNIASTIEEVDSLEVPDDDYVAKMERVSATLQVIFDWKEMPSLLISRQMLDELNDAVLNEILRLIQLWRRHHNTSYLDNASSSGLHAVLNATRGWPPSKDRYARAVTATLKQATQQSETALHTLQHAIAKQVEDDRAREERLNQQLEEHLVEIRSRMDAITDSIDATEQHIARIEGKADQIDTRLDNVISTHEHHFSKAQNERASTWETELRDSRKEFVEELGRAVERSTETLQNQEQSGKRVLERLDELKTDAENVVGAVGTAATANWYKNHADEQQTSANHWRWIATGLFVSAFAVTVAWVLVFEADEHTWSESLLKATLTVSLLAAAGYAVRESSHHLDAEFRARNVELKLRALNPFIANLEEEKRLALTADAARQIFIQDGTVSVSPATATAGKES
jgi:urate oxidase